MITALYASICGVLLAKLTLDVIKLRKKHRVSLGDGGVKGLQVAIGAHANASEYMPITLILLFLLEYSGVTLWLVNLFGVLLVAGRFFHAYGMSNKFSLRVLGMKITFYNLIALSVVNVLVLVLGILA